MSTDVLAGGWAKALGGDRKQFNMFIEKMMDGFAYHKIVVDKAGKPIDYVFLEVNHAFEKMTDLKRESIIGKKVTEVLIGIEKDPADWIGIYGKVALTGEPVQFENHAEPLGKWYNVSAYCPEKGYFVALFEDISERKKAEETLKETEKQLRVIVENSVDGINMLDLKTGKYVFMSPAQVKLTGFTAEEINNISVQEAYDRTHPDDREITIAQQKKVAAGETVSEPVEYRWKVKSGEYRWFSDSRKLVYDDQGQAIAMVGITRDITERKKAEEEVARIASFPLLNPNPILEVGFDGNITYSNPAAKTNFADLETLRLAHPLLSDWQNVVKAFEGKSSGTFNREVKVCKHWYYQEFFLVPNTQRIRIYTMNISERKKAEEALRLSEDHYRTLFSSIGEGFELMELIFDENKAVYDLRYLEVNDTYEKQTGLKAKDVVGKTVKELFPKIERMWIEVFDKVIKTGLPTRLEDYHQDTNRYYSAYYFPFGKKEVGVLFNDITEEKKAEKSIARQAQLIDLSPDAIIVRKLDGAIIFWSKGAEKLYGLTKEEAIGHDINSLLKTEFPQPLEKILKTLKVDGKWSGEIVHTCKNGDKLVVQSFWLAKFGADGKIFEMLESNVDITQRIELQAKLEESAIRVEEYANQMEELANTRAAQLRDAERLAAIGATAGMVGHDIRNPLQAITGDIFLAKTDLIALPESEEKKCIQESLSEIEKNVDYINKIVADLQDFARPLKPNVEETDLKLVIDELLKKNGLPENVKVSVKIETGKIVADSTFINRILYNLVNNAVQAMPKGGKLTIRTYKEAKDVLITVKDTGVGIPEAVKGKLFTPMFTTKSKGQGFGLAVIKRMTESLGGTVSFESQEGKGTTFIVRLPSKS